MWTVLEMILQMNLATEIQFNQQHLYGWVYTVSFAGPHSSTTTTAPHTHKDQKKKMLAFGKIVP